MLKIEKNIPLPEAKQRTSYKFENMQVGDSIFVENALYSNNKVFWAAQKYFNRHDKKMVSKKEETGIRIWRTE